MRGLLEEVFPLEMATCDPTAPLAAVVKVRVPPSSFSKFMVKRQWCGPPLGVQHAKRFCRIQPILLDVGDVPVTALAVVTPDGVAADVSILAYISLVMHAAEERRLSAALENVRMCERCTCSQPTTACERPYG